jgi:hypothetical protein
MPVYTLYGLHFASEFRFAAPLPLSRQPATFTLTRGPETPPGDWEAGAPLYASPFRDTADHPVVTLYRAEAGCRLHFPRAADYFLSERRLHIRPLAHGEPELEEIYLLGTVLSWRREAAGVPVLHAAAVRFEGGAAAFLASNRGGKSSLAASFVQAGAELLTDDLLAVEAGDAGWVGHSGYPRMRLWPDQARRFAGDVEGLAPVSPAIPKLLVPLERLGGAFHSGPLPLRALYLPERRIGPAEDREVRIEPASPRRALIELARHSFLARMVEAAGLQPARLLCLARLAEQVPVRALSFPDGVEYLPEVIAAVQADLRRSA